MKRNPFILVIFALVMNTVVARFIRHPGYMDAYYYFGGALMLAEGRGFTEPYLWNYLDDPAGLPHPSHLYWMPLTSIVAAGPMALVRAVGVRPDREFDFRLAQAPMVLAASLLPLVSYAVARRISPLRRHALAAGLFTIFSGFYVPFWPNTDTFGIYALAGSLCLLCAGMGLETGRPWWWAFAGVFAGLGQLARADGLMLVLVGLLCALFAARSLHSSRSTLHALRIAVLPLLVACAATVAPWLIRNQLAVGTSFSPGGSKALWLTEYNDLFNYPADLTPGRYLAQGWREIAREKLSALRSTVETAVAVHGLVALAPFIVIGLWRLRERPLFWPALVYAPCLYTVMTFGFTYPGQRGGLFHSGAALLPFYFAAAPVGLGVAVDWAARFRPRWRPAQAGAVFTAGLIAIAVGTSLFIVKTRVVGASLADPAWNHADEVYAEIGAALSVRGDTDSVVAVNNPPAFYYFTEHPAVVVPNGGVTTLLAVADRYAARWVVLDANMPAGLMPFYAGDEVHPRLKPVAQFADRFGQPVYLYEVLPP